MKKLQNNTSIKFNNRNYSISLIFFIVPLIILIYYFYSRNYIISCIGIEAICTTISLVLVVITTNKYTNSKHSLFTYIGISFITINVVQIIKLLYAINGVSYTLYSFLFLISVYADFLIIPISYLCYKLNVSYSKYLNINLGISVFVISFLLIIYSMYINLGIHYILSDFWSINIKILALIYIIDLFIIFYSKLNISNIERVYILLFFVFMGIYDGLILYMTIKYNNISPNIFIVAHIIEYTAYYIIYEAISEFLVNNIYNGLYNKLLEREKQKEYSNNLLKERLNVLKELNVLIKKSKGRYDNLINCIVDGIIIFNNDKLKYFNKSGMELLKILGIPFYNNYDKKEMLAEMQSKAKKEKDYILSIKNNDIIKKYSIHEFAIDEITSMIFIKDVTESYKMSNLKMELQNYLIQENSKRDFFANISHEFRTPVNVIFSALQLNDIYIKNKNKSGLSKNKIVIKQNCLRLIRTINNFIEANKVSEGYMDMHLEMLNIVDVIESISDEANDYIKRMNLSFIFDSEEEEIFVNADKDFLQRIYLNLLSNSLKYSDPGGNIFTNIKVNGDKVVISVINDTKTIKEEDKETIFDIFSKSEQPFSLRKEGSGLGLYISRSLTNLMGGTIELKTSKFNNEFIVTFKKLDVIDIDYDNPTLFSTLYNINDLREKIDIEFSDIYFD